MKFRVSTTFISSKSVEEWLRYILNPQLSDISPSSLLRGHLEASGGKIRLFGASCSFKTATRTFPPSRDFGIDFQNIFFLPGKVLIWVIESLVLYCSFFRDGICAPRIISGVIWNTYNRQSDKINTLWRHLMWKLCIYFFKAVLLIPFILFRKNSGFAKSSQISSSKIFRKSKFAGNVSVLNNSWNGDFYLVNVDPFWGLSSMKFRQKHTVVTLFSFVSWCLLGFGE